MEQSTNPADTTEVEDSLIEDKNEPQVMSLRFLFECIALGWWEIVLVVFLPQVAETKLPQPMDVTDPGPLYDLNG